MLSVCLDDESCLTLCNPLDCSLPGFSVHGIFQERILEWAAISSSRGSSRPRDQTHVSWIMCLLTHCLRILYHAETLGKPLKARVGISAGEGLRWSALMCAENYKDKQAAHLLVSLLYVGLCFEVLEVFWGCRNDSRWYRHKSMGVKLYQTLSFFSENLLLMSFLCLVSLKILFEGRLQRLVFFFFFWSCFLGEH